MAKFNLNLSDSTYAEVSEMAERLDISMADVVREALNLLSWVTREISANNRLMIGRNDYVVEVVMPELEKLRGSTLKSSGDQPHSSCSVPTLPVAKSYTDKQPPLDNDATGHAGLGPPSRHGKNYRTAE